MVGTESKIQKEIVGNRFFYRLAMWVLRVRWVVLVLLFGVSLLMGKQVAEHLKFDITLERFLASGDETALSLEKLRDTFGQDLIHIVFIKGDVFSMPYLSRLKKLHESLASLDLDIKTLGQRRLSITSKNATKLEGFGDDEGWGEEGTGTIVEHITSLINIPQTLADGSGIKVEGLLEKWPSEGELEELKRRVLADKNIVGNVVDSDGNYSAIAILTDFMSEEDMGRVYDEIVSIAKSYQTDGFEVTVTGAPAVNKSLKDLTKSSQLTIFVLSSFVVVVFVSLMFKHPIGIIGPILVVWLADVWTLAVMTLVNVPISVTTSLLTGFIGCIGVADSVHVQSVYRDARSRGMTNHEAIAYSMATTGIPILFTTLTTAMGLLSLTFADIGGVSEMGAFSAVGVSFALLFTLTVLPITLSFNRKSLLGLNTKSKKRRPIDKLLDFCNGLTRPEKRDGRIDFRRRNIVVVATVLLTVLVAVGVSKVRLYYDALDWLPEDHPTRTAVRELEAHISGTSNIAVMVQTPEGRDLRDKELVESLERLEEYILEYDDGSGNKTVRSVTSFLDPIRESYRALNGGKQEFYRLPDTERGISDMITLFENAAPEDLGRLVTVDMKTAVMLARVKWLDALSSIPLAQYIERGVADIIGDKAVIQITGTAYVVMRIFSLMLMDLVTSFGTALAVITAIMMLLLADIKLGLLAMIPNLLPIFAVMGLMGFGSVPMDLNALLVSSLAIGIVVDDTIHFIHQFQVYFKEYGDVEQAIEHTFEHTGRAIVATSVILASGFLCNLSAELSSFVVIGVLLAVTMLIALVVDLVLSPALLRLVFRSSEKKLPTVCFSEYKSPYV